MNQEKVNPEERRGDENFLPLPLGADIGLSLDKTEPATWIDWIKKIGSGKDLRNLSREGERREERGFVMILALGLITLFSLMATGYVTMGVRNTQIGSDFRYASEALSTAEAGVHFAIGQMNGGDIVPPVPEISDPVADSIWRNWHHSLVTPGYGSEVEISYVVTLMLPHFDTTTGEYPKDKDRYFRIKAKGSGALGTKKTIEVITAQPGPKGFNFHYAWQLDGDANLKNPATFSGHSDSLPPVRLTSNKPYFDVDNDGDYNSSFDRGWNVGPLAKQLERINLSDPHPDSINFNPNVPYLHSAGNIHSNGDLILDDQARVNGKVTAKGEVTKNSSGDPFVQGEDHYVLGGYTNHIPKKPKINIPTNEGYWYARSLKDTTIHIITMDNYHDYDFSFSAGAFSWNETDPIPPGIYYFTDDVKMAGNPTGNATIITDFKISLSGHPEQVSNNNLMAYIAGGDIRANGTGYVQGLLYTKGNLVTDSDICILGSVYVGGEGDIAKFTVVVFDTKLKEVNLLPEPVPPAIVSWQEIFE